MIAVRARHEAKAVVLEPGLTLRTLREVGYDRTCWSLDSLPV
jgi:hypothetical protein